MCCSTNQHCVTIIPIIAPEGTTKNISYVELDDASGASNSASIADSYNPDEPVPDHLCQSKQILDTNLVL